MATLWPLCSIRSVLTLIVTSVGASAALPAASALTQLLLGISPLDATNFCSSVGLLGLMSVAACVIRHCGPCALTVFVR